MRFNSDFVRLTKRLLCVSTALVFLSSTANGQVNGTWSGQSGTWGTGTNWVGGNIADGGGVATFDNFRGQLTNIAVTNDARTLSGITWNQSFTATINGGTITMGPSGLTLNSINSTRSSEVGFYTTVNQIGSVIAGTGDLVKTGNGSASIGGTAANSFVGQVQINQGTLWLTNSTGDGGLGNAANSISLNGGVFGVNSTGGWTSARTINVGAGGGIIRGFTAITHTGALTGSGTLASQIGTGQTYSGNLSGFTGAYRADGGSAVTFNGATAFGGSADVTIGGTMTLSNATNNVSNRLNGRNVQSLGGTLVYAGNAAAASNEVAGNLNLLSGSMTITMQPNAAQEANLTFANVNRIDRSTLFSRGISGAAPGAGVGNLIFTNSPGTLVGGGGAVTSTTASILPWMLNNTVNNTTFGPGLSFVTWDSGSGRIIPLDVATGYQTDLSLAAANENVSLNTAGTFNVNPGGQTVNSLRFGIAGITLAGGSGDAITVTSGAVLSTASTTTISAPVNFGSAEGVLFASGAMNISGPISGTNGITKAGVGTLTLSNTNTYTGTTTLTNGNTTVAGGLVDGSGPSVFGQDTSAINILSTQNTAGAATRIWTNGNLTINRDLYVKLGGGQVTGIGTAGASAAESLTINGNVVLDAVNPDTLTKFLNLEGGDNAAEAVRINGNISGTGALRGSFGSYNILTGNNSYSGGTLVGTSAFTNGLTGNLLELTTETWEIHSNTAFGTGVVNITSSTSTGLRRTAAIQTGGSSPITLANDIVLQQGYARFTGSQALTLNGNLYLNSAATNNSVVNVDSLAAPVTLNGVINGGGLIKNGAGTLTLAGNNTYSGQTIVRQGVLSVANIGNAGTVGNMGQGLATSNYLLLTGNAVGDTGTLRYTGTGEATNRLFSLGGTGGTIDSSGSGALVFNNTGSIGVNFGSFSISGIALTAGAGQIAGMGTTNTSQIVVGSTVTNTTTPGSIAAGTVVTEVGPDFVRLNNNLVSAATAQTLVFTLPGAVTSRTLNLTGSNTGSNTIASNIGNGTNINVSVNKSGTGKWVLTGTNTYAGTTSVTNGTLIVDGIHNNGGAYTVSAGATLGGNGQINNSDVTIQPKGILSPGNELGILRIGQSLNMGGRYDWQIASAANGDMVTVGGNLSITGLLTLNFLADLDYEKFDKFNLFAYQGSFSGGFANSIAGWEINYDDKTPGVNGVQVGSWTYVTARPLDRRFRLFGSIGYGGKGDQYSAVPEPTSLAFGCVMLALVSCRRSRRRA